MMNTRSLISASLLLVLGTAASCATGAGPSQPISLGAVLDSLRLAESLSALQGRFGGESVGGRLMIAYNDSPKDTLITGHIIESALPAPLADSVEATLRSALTETDRSWPQGPITFLLTLGDSISMTARRSVTTAPQLSNASELQYEMGRLAERVLTQGSRRVELWLRLATDGRVDQAEIRRGTGVVPIDSGMVSIFRRAQFSPALLEGKPVQVWVSVPATLYIEPDTLQD
jgi:TonB family protein